MSTDKPNLHLVAPDPFDPDALRLDQSFLYGSTRSRGIPPRAAHGSRRPQDHRGRKSVPSASRRGQSNLVFPLTPIGGQQDGRH